VVNLLVCPGMGTIMAGRRLTGFAQAIVMLVGVCLTVAWGLLYLKAVYAFALDGSATEAKWRTMQPPGAFGIAGIALCAVSWLWALFSSFQILNESRRHQPL